MGVLTFMVRSYFTSDAFRRGYSGSVRNNGFVEALCDHKARAERDRCAGNVDKALASSFSGCSSAMQDMLSCYDSRMDVKIAGDRCSEEEASVFNCLKSNVVSRLQQLGFISEEISALDVLFEGDAKKGNLRKQKMSEGVERPTENPGDADVARGNEDSPEVDIVEGPRGGEGADAGKADANVPGIHTESAGR
ncbi:unnamed protein product [Ascophyllum nodosum]